MNAADRLRAAKRSQYRALSHTGIYSQTVEIFLFVSETGQRHYAGYAGERHYLRLTLEPNPSITLKQRSSNTAEGPQTDNEVLLTGAFPNQLIGLGLIVNVNGEETTGESIIRNYATPTAFRNDIETADYFRISGEIYQFIAAGQLEIDPIQSEWSLRLVRKP